MTTLKARFDGRVLVPEQPVDLPQDCVLQIHVEEATPVTNGAAADTSAEDAPPLAALVEWVKQLPDDPDSPTDLAAQHDHYLYGMPKRP